MALYVDIDYWLDGYTLDSVPPAGGADCYLENDTDYWATDYAECIAGGGGGIGCYLEDDVDYWGADYAVCDGGGGIPPAGGGEECYLIDDNDYWIIDYVECVGGRPTWGTFPDWPSKKRLGEWWRSARKKVEEKVEEIVEPLPVSHAEAIERVTKKLVRERQDVAQLRKKVEQQFEDQNLRFNRAAQEAVRQVQNAIAATVERAQRYEAEIAELERQRGEQRKRNALRILKMLH